MPRIIEYPKYNALGASDSFVVDSATATFRIEAGSLIDFALVAGGMGMGHKSIFRSEHLGSSITPAQLTAIRNGTFNDLFVGDYWVINGFTFQIMDINYFPAAGAHIVVVPSNVMVPSGVIFSESDSDKVNLINSEFVRTTLPVIVSRAGAAFGPANLKSFQVFTTKEIVAKEITQIEEYTTKAWMMTSMQLSGQETNALKSATTVKLTPQFAGFRLRPDLFHSVDYASYALADVVGEGKILGLNTSNWSIYNATSTAVNNFRPFFVVG